MHGGLHPFAQLTETIVTIHAVEPLDLIKTATPASESRIFVSTESVGKRIKECRGVAFADIRLRITGTQRILAVVHILLNKVGGIGHCTIIPAATEMMVEQDGNQRMVLFNVGASCILIPDTVKHCLRDCSLIVFGMVALQLLESLGSCIRPSPTLNIDGAWVIFQQHLHNTVGTRGVRP